MSIHSKQSGYTLLFAVLVSVLVLGVAVFISGTARKQYILSSTALDSMYSFYAADSGIECVAASGVPSSTAPVTITCNTQTPAISYSSVADGSYSDLVSGTQKEANFNVGFYPPDQPNLLTGCAVIKIDTYQNKSGGWSAVVQSRGYNLCTGASTNGPYGPDTTSPRTVERALQLNTEL
jgi:hypothetical protein